MQRASDVTDLLAAWTAGDRAAQSRLLEVVYEELKQLARSYLRREPSDGSLAATGLVHEAYLKLVDQRQVHWQNRHHFYGIAAQAMRRILVDRARAAGAAKRRAPHDTYGASDESADPVAGIDLLALDEALSRLEALEPRWSRLVELRFFAGLTVAETATVLGLSPATVKRDWSLARGWLYRELRGVPVAERPETRPLR
jgi:RNA polymerase sigma-70 factor, ECF subfamily